MPEVKKSVVAFRDHYLMIDGKKYRAIFSKRGEAVLRQVSDDEWDKLITETANILVDKSGLSPVDVVKEVLSELPLNEIKRIQTKAKKVGVRVKPGCLSLVLGKEELPIVC